MIQGVQFKKYVLVGGMGIIPRSGTTHNMIVLGNYLKEKGYKVALVEVNSNNAFSAHADSIPINMDNENHFVFNEIDYYAKVDNKKFKSICDQEYDFKTSYDFVIADFGAYIDGDSKMFEQCDEKFIITGNKAWETEKLDLLFEKTPISLIRKLHFCFNFTDKLYYEGISKGMEGTGSVHFLKYTSDPFYENEFPGADEIFKKYQKIEEEAKQQRLMLQSRSKGSDNNE